MTFQLAGSGPEIYERVMVPLWFGKWAKSLLDSISLEPGDRVLDVACGTGVTTRLAKDRVGHQGLVKGLDVNAAMLAKAMKLAAGRDIGWVESDVVESGFPDGSFDAVISQHGYHYFPDKPAALIEMGRLLAPGGRLAFSIWDGHCPYTEAICKALEQHVSPQIASQQRSQRETPTAEDLERQVRAAGFSRVTLLRQEQLIDVPLAEEFVPLHLGSMPIAGAFAALSEKRKRMLIDQISTMLQPYVVAGRIRYPDAVHVVIAQM
ncbi:Ubiquinone/menaquinone biosynthesis C-methylase UbiE [Jannaschia faecimaris]|uniref:Ubiquinone/menaquinone biosynthesis C-methylase UbiE n=1 Tax=Jannaschia faecimaris TaxID=1244108 RepID=A0A1H3J5I0_9RHOB|nr:methyltransferase domain-containing protein [Jannaschia faecimaris]SDY34708.1 Ubiquinone/menaquinone biosynthesis C-methylase UbiE [Jannaschia faecimaris]